MGTSDLAQSSWGSQSLVSSPRSPSGSGLTVYIAKAQNVATNKVNFRRLRTSRCVNGLDVRYHTTSPPFSLQSLGPLRIREVGSPGT